MDIFTSVFLGLLQGLTEFLPVSSSGHLAIAQNFFGFESEQSMAFAVMLHLGTLAAVFIMYSSDIFLLIKGFFTLAAKLVTGRIRKCPLETGERLFLMLAVATIPLLPAALLEDHVASLSAVSWAVGLLLILNGGILFLSDRLSAGNMTVDGLGPKKALFIGLIQMVAILPGISRSGSTITGGLFAGLKREDAVRFSFLLSLPAILGANILKLPELFDDPSFSAGLPVMAAGVAAALLSGIAAIKLLKYISKNKRFTVFSVYCIIAGAVTVVADLLF